jgi:OmpA-OmpF porin, OOP family
MKQTIMILCAVLAFSSTYAQGKNKTFLKRPAIGVHFLLHDFKTADLIKRASLGTALAGKDWRKTRNMSAGMALSFHKGILDNLDYSVTLGGSFLNYPNINNPFASFGQDRLLLEGDASVQLKLTSDKYWVSPYLSAGIGASHWNGYFGAVIPLGMGIQVNLYDESFLFLNSQFRKGISANVNDHVYYSVGIAGNIGRVRLDELMKKPELPVTQVKRVDTDGDGVYDDEDKCVSEKGLVKYMGCPVPDTDGDGINDEEDKCKTEAGIEKYQGCPIPDTDGDGVNDEQDKCKNEAGPARNDGCPIADTDGDGINDEEDKCINEAGTAANSGCPEISKEVMEKIEYAAKNIYFATGSSNLLAKSNKGLNEVVAIMKENEDLMLDIEGHTDNTGKADKNQKLSEARANAVKAYLVKKGISEDRLAAAGFGDSQPVADNKTAAGRQENRRVELKIKNN